MNCWESCLYAGFKAGISPEVMSLWNIPGPEPVFQRTTLKKILAAATNEYTITMSPPPW